LSSLVCVSIVPSSFHFVLLCCAVSFRAIMARAVKPGNLFLIFGPMWLKDPGQLTSSRHKIKLLTRPIWAPACQGYLVGLASLTTHMPGHIIKAGPGPSSQRETTRL